VSKLKAAVRALKKGDKALAERELAGDLESEPAEATLLRGILSRSPDEIRRGVGKGPTDAGLVTEGAKLLLKQQHWVAALEALVRLAELVTGADRARVKRRLANIELTLGRYHDAVASYRTALALTPGSSMIAMELAQQLRGLGDFQAAFDVIESLPELPPELARVRVQLLVDLQRHDEARTAALGIRDVELLMMAGAFDAAKGLLEEQRKNHPDDPRVLLALAELASWRGEHLVCESLAARVLEIEPGSVQALRLRGTSHLFSGEIELAEADLSRVVEQQPDDPLGLIWLAEIDRRHQRWAPALEHLYRGIERTRGYPLGAHASQVATHASRTFDGELDPDLHRELCVILTPVFSALGIEGTVVTNQDVHRRMEAALGAMQGNRGPRPSFVRDGKLVPLDLPVHARFLSRSIQELLRTRTPEYVLSALEALGRERPTEPTVACHLGEIHLWLGDYARAETAFLAAIELDRATRWAYVGLCAVETCRAHYEAAIEWCARGAKEAMPGRTQYAYRGEAYRRLGDSKRALEDLEHSLELTPTRISAWMNLSLVERDRALLNSTFRALQKQAPGLVDDACRELGLDVPRLLGETDAIARVFEHALLMMRGNRASSLVSYFTERGELRFVPAEPPRHQPKLG
jgi:tetratricopeptide (TPR) repeat protein